MIAVVAPTTTAMGQSNDDRGPLKRTWGLVGLLGALACKPSASTPDHKQVPPVPQPEVLFAGCAEFIEDSCVLPPQDAPLTVWVDVHEHAALRIQLDDHLVEPSRVAVDGGVRLRIEVDQSAETITIDGGSPTWEQPWALPIRRTTPPPQVAEGLAMFRAGEREEAVEHVRAALPGLDGLQRLAALKWIAAAEWRLGGPAPALQDAQELAVTLGALRTGARSAHSSLHTALDKRRFTDVAPLRDHLRIAAKKLPEAALWANLSEGRYAVALGETSRAIAAEQRATRLAHRLDLPQELQEGTLELLNLHTSLSQWSRAHEQETRLLTLNDIAGINCKNRAYALASIGWSRLQASIAGQRDAWPEPPSEQALALTQADGDCPDPWAATNIRINLALSSLQGDDPGLALAWLEGNEQVPEDLKPWVEQVRAQAGLVLGRPWLLPEPMSIPEQPRPDDLYNAWVVQARVREYYGASESAIEAWSAAEAVVEQRAAGIALGSGREHYLTGRNSIASGLVDALTRAGRIEDALCRARLARNRALRLIDHNAALGRARPQVRQRWTEQRLAFAELRNELSEEAVEDWSFPEDQRLRRRARREEREQAAIATLAEASNALQARPGLSRCDELPKPTPGTVHLVFFPGESNWYVFAADAEGASVGTLPKPLVTDRALRLPASLRTRVSNAERIRIVAAGEAIGLSIPALVAGDTILLEQAPIVHALDLPPRSAASTTTALVVSDPSRDLDYARREAKSVTALLRGRDWSVDTLAGGQATRDAVLAALPNVSVFHYAGHGDNHGESGWNAALILHDNQRLSVQDILTLPSSPALVILAGCETGAADAQTLAGGMNPGRAFVLAGSSAAVVASRTVDDQLAARVSAAVHRAAPTDAWALAQLLREEQLAVRSERPGSDWAAFRVVVP